MSIGLLTTKSVENSTKTARLGVCPGIELRYQGSPHSGLGGHSLTRGVGIRERLYIILGQDSSCQKTPRKPNLFLTAGWRHLAVTLSFLLGFFHQFLLLSRGFAAHRLLARTAEGGISVQRSATEHAALGGCCHLSMFLRPVLPASALGHPQILF